MKDYVSAKEAANMLDVDKRVVWRAIRTGKIKAALVGGCYRIPVTEIRETLRPKRKPKKNSLPEPVTLNKAVFLCPDGSKLIKGEYAEILACRTATERGNSLFLCRKGKDYFLFTERAALLIDIGETGVITPVTKERAICIYNKLPMKQDVEVFLTN